MTAVLAIGVRVAHIFEMDVPGGKAGMPALAWFEGTITSLDKSVSVTFDDGDMMVISVSPIDSASHFLAKDCMRRYPRALPLPTLSYLLDAA